MLHITLNNDLGYSNKITLSKQGLKRFTKVVPSVITITQAHSAERRRVERFIESTYSAHYSAKISEHYPILMSVRDANDTILAALGFRPADKNELFLEQYLDTSIEQVLTEHLLQPVFRHDIIEVGNLSATTSGASIFLFISLNAWLKQHGYKTVVVTATQGLKRFFSMLKLDYVQLGSAESQRVPNATKQWGSYYQKKPQILAGSIMQTEARMHEMLNVHFVDEIPQMYSRLHHQQQVFSNE
jgi:hypothetical protein